MGKVKLQETNARTEQIPNDSKYKSLFIWILVLGIWNFGSAPEWQGN
jgi:hypothetical protein